MASQAERFREIVNDFAKRADVTVWKPTKQKYGQVGFAYITEEDQKAVKAPVPRSPTSLFIFLHGIAHHYLNHINRPKPGHIEEFEANREALRVMKDNRIPIPPRLAKEARKNVLYSVTRDKRKGLSIRSDVQRYLNEN